MKKLLAVTGMILITCVCAEAVFASPVSKITSTQVASLPKQDAKKLKEGISAATRQELEKALEDYCS